MRDSTVFDDGVRLTDGIRVRVPAEFRERMKAAAEAEGIAPTEFVRRAIAERISRNSRNSLGSIGPGTTQVAAEPSPDTASPSTPHAAAEAVTAPVPASPAPPPAQAADKPANPSRRRASWT